MKGNGSNPGKQGLPDRDSRQLFEKNAIYRVDTICLKLNTDSTDFIDILLRRKLELVLKHYRGGLLVDLCCATGEHLLHLADNIERGVGIDFSFPYLQEARKRCDQQHTGDDISFVAGNARKLPLSDETVDMLYSLSSLYVIPDLGGVVREIARVLKPGGACMLDLGASRSLNTVCCKAYPEIAPSFHIPRSRMRHILRSEGLEIVEHRAFQILPYWADRPAWLWPLLHPFWKRLMQRKVAGRMLDEWVSNLPLIRNFAFRHLIVAKKLNAKVT